MRFIQVRLTITEITFVVAVDEQYVDTCVDHLIELAEQYDTDNGGVVDIKDKMNFICDNIQQEVPCSIVHENAISLSL